MRIVFYLLWMLLLGILQPTLGRGIDLWGVAPNFFLCFVVIMSFCRGKMEGAIVGAVAGLVYDLLIGRLIGVHGLLYFYVGFGAGYLSEEFFSGAKSLAIAIVIAVATIVVAFLYYLVRTMAFGDADFTIAIFRTALPEVMINCIVGLLMAPLLRGSMKLCRMKEVL